MKRIVFLCVCFIITFTLQAQDWTRVSEGYKIALESYQNKNFEKSAKEFSEVIKLAKGINNLSDYALYNGACIFALNNNKGKTFEILNFLANERLFSKLEQIQKDDDFKTLHDTKEWQEIISKISENKETFPYRNRQTIKTRLLEAKKILEEDNGQLWGYKIWNDSIIVIDYDNSIYSLIKLENSKTDDDTLYYKVLPPNTLAFVNTTQKYNNKNYATVLKSYLKDKSSTIIHELFHLLQFKFRTFNGEPIDYLDETNARILLRLEYQALKNALNTIIANEDTAEVKKYLNDAIIFRKERQNTYSEYLQKELEIETLEGMANYTGFVLSSYKNKYQKAIDEINERERAETYTRPFPYATGVAYGLLFDYLNIKWKNGLDKIYNFANIYETKVVQSKIKINKEAVKQAQQRNNFDGIYKQEKEREKTQNNLIDYYTKLLIDKPTLKVVINDFDNYSRSYNMNGTLVLKNIGTVYSSIRGRDKSGGKNFGDFSTIKDKDKLGVAGILSYEKNEKNYFSFPLPIKIEGNKIIGEFYEIKLNSNWKVKKYEDGNMETVKK